MRESIINIATNAALAAGKLIMRAADRLDTVKVSEKQPNDYVTEIDQRAEQEIIKIIHKAYPTHSIMGEESGEIQGDDFQWIIDPIDGTRNFVHGFPHFAVSIAVSYKGKVEHGVIYDPVRDELFSASRGKGAKLNNRKIRVSTRREFKTALLGTGFAFRHAADYPEGYAKLVEAFLPHCSDIRRAGAATLDLAYVAAGRLDGFWEMGLHKWDMAAGALLVKEAGGFVTDPHGGDDYMATGNIVAGNPTVLKSLIKMMKPYL